MTVFEDAPPVVLPHEDYINEVCDLIDELGFDVRGEAAFLSQDGELVAVLPFVADDLRAVTVTWTGRDGWEYAPADTVPELCAGLTPPPSLVAAAVHALLIGAAHLLPLLDDPERPAPAWDGQDAFEAELADWQAANPTTTNGDPS
jgi:hypothetical protein